jgi:hypothetical protein
MSKLLSKNEFKELMRQHPEGGIVFAEDPKWNDVHVTDGDFGATVISPLHGEIFDYDWNIEEYGDDEMFIVFDNDDILQMIQILTKGLKINLKDE